MSSPHDVTRLLQAWSDGDPEALEKLTPLVYQELHCLARRYIAGERPGHTLQATALVHEAYLKLTGESRAHWQNRAHFFAVSAQIMRHILVDWARARQYQKREGEGRKVPLEEALVTTKERGLDLEALDDALKALAKIDPRKSQLVELRFFGGLSVEETAEVLKISPRTVMREWGLAQSWLYRELSQEKSHDA